METLIERRHYCTYFDRHYLAQGMVLLRSLERHDPGCLVWVLCLDTETETVIRDFADDDVRLLGLDEIERFDPELRFARADRSWVEYLFTLSPCLPRFVLRMNPEIGMVTYLDADMQFLSAAEPMFREFSTSSVFVVEHGFPVWLSGFAKRGRFNVGILSFRNDEAGNECLEWWRERCLEWCRDVVEHGRYADQKYLDRWPDLFSGVHICSHPGVNVGPWNWMTRAWSWNDEVLTVNAHPVVLFHFAAARFLTSDQVDSAQIEYAVMPFGLRNRLYGRYFEELENIGAEIARVLPGFSIVRPANRGQRMGLKAVLLQAFFGARWRRRATGWHSPHLGLGPWSGRILAGCRRVLSPGGGS